MGDLPTIAELATAAAESQRGWLSEGSAAEAWEIAWTAAGRIDPDIPGSEERHMAGVPEAVARTMRAFGIVDLCASQSPIGVLRGQFMTIFGQLAAKAKREACCRRRSRQSSRRSARSG